VPPLPNVPSAKRQLGLAGVLGELGAGCATGLVLALDVGSTAAMIGVTNVCGDWSRRPDLGRLSGSAVSGTTVVADR
jgi:hypothetical protein